MFPPFYFRFRAKGPRKGGSRYRRIAARLASSSVPPFKMISNAASSASSGDVGRSVRVTALGGVDG